MKLGELFWELGFKADTVQINDFIGMVGKLNLSTVLASFGVKELYDGLKGIMSIAEETALGMNLFGKETGLSAQKMTQWSRYAEQLGINGEVVASTLTGLQKKLIGLKLGTDQSLLTPFYILNQAGAGITGNESPFELVDKFLATVKKLDPTLRTTVADMMGINVQLLAMDSFKGADVIPVPTTEQVSRLMAYHAEWKKVGQSLNQVFTDIGAQYAPELEKLGQAFEFILGKLHEFSAFIKPIFEVILAIAAINTGPLAAIGALIFIIATNLKEVGMLLDSIKSKLPNIDLGALRTNVEGFIGNASKNVQSTIKNAETTMTNTFNIVGNDAKDIAKEVHKVVGDLLSDAQYQQPLTSR